MSNNHQGGVNPLRRPVSSLHVHPAMELVPRSSPEPREATFRAVREQGGVLVPLVTLASGAILSGRDRLEAAIAAKIKIVPVKVVDIPEDAVEIEVLRLALSEKHLSDDQRACLALELGDRLSKRLASERARTAANARHGRKKNACRPTATDKQDSRRDACLGYGVSEKKFRIAKQLRAEDAERYKAVLRGECRLREARNAVEIGRKQEAVEERKRIATTLAEAPDYVLGDCAEVIAQLPDNSITAIVTDPPFGVALDAFWRSDGPQARIDGDGDVTEALLRFDRMLSAAESKIRCPAHLFSFAPAKYETEFRNTITNHGWVLKAFPVWIKNSQAVYPTGSFSSRHERIIYAIKGNARVVEQRDDVLQFTRSHETTHPSEKPVKLMAELIRLVTVEGEWVLDPFAGTGATVVAARQLRRRVTGIEIDPRWFNEGRVRLAETESFLSGSPRLELPPQL